MVARLLDFEPQVVGQAKQPLPCGKLTADAAVGHDREPVADRGHGAGRKLEGDRAIEDRLAGHDELVVEAGTRPGRDAAEGKRADGGRGEVDPVHRLLRGHFRLAGRARLGQRRVFRDHRVGRCDVHRGGGIEHARHHDATGHGDRRICRADPTGSREERGCQGGDRRPARRWLRGDARATDRVLDALAGGEVDRAFRRLDRADSQRARGLGDRHAAGPARVEPRAGGHHDRPQHAEAEAIGHPDGVAALAGQAELELLGGRERARPEFACEDRDRLADLADRACAGHERDARARDVHAAAHANRRIPGPRRLCQIET